MKYDLEQMKRDLLNQTKANFDRKEGDATSKYFNPDLDLKFWRALPTKGAPHIIDIIPFIAGDKYPTKTTGIKPGQWAYVLDLYVHSNVGPGKVMVVCPAMNYGEPCPVCDEVAELQRQNVDWNDIPFTAKRRCSYNVLVMDNEKTEADGIQIWEATYHYSEKQILALAKNARTGAFIPFANLDRSIGRSIAFDVGNDKYRKITGHRFEVRDYDIPESYLEQAHQLDQLIVVYAADELKKLMWGSAGKKPETEAVEEHDTQEAPPPARRSLRGGSPQPADEAAAPLQVQKAPEEAQPKPRLRPVAAGPTCEYGATFGSDYGKYGECEGCDQAQLCAETADRRDAGVDQKPPVVAPPATQAPPPPAPPQQAAGAGAPPRRTLLRRTTG